MPLEIPKRSRPDLIQSIQDFVREEHGLEWGIIAAEAFLDYAVAEIGPAVYNKALRDAQARMASTVADLDLDLSVQEMQHSRDAGKR